MAAERIAPPKLFGVIVVVSAVIAVITVAALLFVSFFISEVPGKGMVSAETYVFLVVLTLAVFGIEALLIRQLSRLLSAYLQTGGAVPNKTTVELQSSQSAAQLSEPRQTTASIPTPRETTPIEVEQMTRKLETDE